MSVALIAIGVVYFSYFAKTKISPEVVMGGEAGGDVTSVSGTVSLTPDLANQTSPTDLVFIFAKAVDGPQLPLAVIRAEVRDLPKSFVLNDSMAMTPDLTLSQFPKATIIARISKSGDAHLQKGDLESQPVTAKVGSRDLQLVIDHVVNSPG